MKKVIPLLFAAMLTACSKSEPITTTSTPSPTETIDSLVANPERLKELRLQCKTDRGELGDELCNRVAEAANRRFLGDSKTPHTPPKEQPKF